MQQDLERSGQGRAAACTTARTLSAAAAGAGAANTEPSAVSDMVEQLATAVGELLQQRGWSITTAESCTGGLIGAAITEVAGSSGWFEHGFITYSNAAKSTWLGVPAALIEAEGAVSEQVVAAMAEGARFRAGAGIAVAVSGIAGPGGGSAAKPVGTVWIGWACSNAAVTTARFQLAGGASGGAARSGLRSAAWYHSIA